MQFPNIEDDEVDFGANSTTRSRLSSLFQTEKASGDVNQALTFTAPKQPKKNDNSQNSQGILKLIHASAVHAYKLVDGNYTNQGKLGCAILGLHETSNYRILLYKGKQDKVATCNIHPLFKFQVQQNNYATFYDDRNENWSVNFDSETALFDFAKQISLAKANNVDQSQPHLIIQDIILGEGPTLDTGDSAEVKYTGWLLTNFSFGQIFDCNMQSESAFRLRLGKKVIKGWSDGLIGAQKGTRRLLIVPPHLAYGAEGIGSAVPSNSTLIFDIVVVKAKVSRDSSPLKATENLLEKKPRHSITSEDIIRQRGASISEQLTQSPKKDKAQLISRMAKMGTATLPFQGAAQVGSDSESEEELPLQLGGSRTSSPKPASRSSSLKNSDHSISTQPVQLQSVQEKNVFHPSTSLPFYPPTVMHNQPTYNPAFQPQMTSQYQLSQAQYSLHAMPSLVPQVSIADTHLPMLISETRGQNTEMRLSLSKIAEKIDTVIQKVDDVRYNRERSSGLSYSSLMDSSLLLQSIERIVQENSLLKEDVEAKNSKIQSLNEKIYDLLQRNQRFYEESSNMLEQKSDSLQTASAETQAKLLVLEKEKVKLSSELTDALRKLGSAEVKLANHESELLEEQKHVEELHSKLSNLSKKLESESSTNILQSEIKTLSEENSVLSTQIKSWEEKYATLNKDLIEKTKESQLLQEEVNKTESTKFTNTTKSEGLLKEKVNVLEAELQSALPWKGKFEVFYRKTLQLKENYESEVKRLEAKLQQAQLSVVSSEPPDFSGEIKKMMNILYKLLQGKFEPSSSYSGAEVLETTFQAIRTLIIQLLQRKGSDTIAKEADSTDEVKSSNANVGNNESSVVAILENEEGALLSNELLTKTEPPLIGKAEEKSSENSSSGSENESIDQPPLQNHTEASQNCKIENSIANEESLQSKKEEVVSPASPDLSTAPDNSIVGNTKIWKPQPPPLFDDDSEDDDDWLK